VDITDKIVKFMKGGSGWKIVSIDILTIETYTYRRAEGGSYILTPKALANKKCTINPDNKDLIDPDTGLPSEKCLQGALGAYFAYKDGHTQKLERIFRAEKFKPYLERVNLNAIPIPLLFVHAYLARLRTSILRFPLMYGNGRKKLVFQNLLLQVRITTVSISFTSWPLQILQNRMKGSTVRRTTFFGSRILML
jgi:hypothetical protein